MLSLPFQKLFVILDTLTIILLLINLIICICLRFWNCFLKLMFHLLDLRLQHLLSWRARKILPFQFLVLLKYLLGITLLFLQLLFDIIKFFLCLLKLFSSLIKFSFHKFTALSGFRTPISLPSVATWGTSLKFSGFHTGSSRSLLFSHQLLFIQVFKVSKSGGKNCWDRLDMRRLHMDLLVGLLVNVRCRLIICLRIRRCSIWRCWKWR